MNKTPSPREAFTRPKQLEQLVAGELFDMLVIGGGATGAGIAVDAASRGYRVAVVEQVDFGKGTSSRSTKLVHGGVRYLEQGDVKLVRDALHERGLLLRNAPHLVYKLPTVLPLYRWWEPVYYRIGLTAYDLLAGRLGFGRSKSLSRSKTIEALPTINQNGLRGGIRYYDGGFDDARLLINLIQTAVDHGAVCVNHARVTALLKTNGKVVGAEVLDQETQSTFEVKAKVVINAAGPYGDAIRRLATPDAKDWIRPSQGIHLVLDRSFLPCDNALIVPKTSDGRVVFAIPWHEHTLVGTTDTGLERTPLEPTALRSEIDFLLETINGCLAKPVAEKDIRSLFAGLRPLVRKDSSESTSKLGRDHTVRIDETGLVTMLGGKWTTYRKMAKDCVNQAANSVGLPARDCKTGDLPIRGSAPLAEDSTLRHYGDDAPALQAFLDSCSDYAERLDAELPNTVGEALWAIRYEMARTVEDVLSRRLRMLLLNARAALRAAPRVASLLAEENGHDEAWIVEELDQFRQLAKGYTVEGCLESSNLSSPS